MNLTKQLQTFSPVLRNRAQSVADTFDSELLSLAFSSDVNNPNPAQFERAKKALIARAELASHCQIDRSLSGGEYLSLCREIVETHLADRIEYFGESQCAVLPDASSMALEGRDTFLVIKFMDEAPHIQATIDSLLTQDDIDHQRLVIVACDNMSNDASCDIVRDAIKRNTTNIRLVLIHQTVSGGGSAARFGVDACLATIQSMCLQDDDWSRLHTARIAVSDGDTVYHPHLLADGANTLDEDNNIDGVMPFLMYKSTSCHRFFKNYIPRDNTLMRTLWSQTNVAATRYPARLATLEDAEAIPRQQRTQLKLDDCEGMMIKYRRLTGGVAQSLFVPFNTTLPTGLKFGVLQDPEGCLAFLDEEGILTIDSAPVSGSETALKYIENGSIDETEKWKWHAMIGHDIFLLWSFQHMGLSESLILPDTSDALKMFRAWAFSVGGQHQLSKPDMKRVTGTDYQSGRVIQSFGGQTVLGSSYTYSETEVDRLAKMIRNFANDQSVFYGNTRSRGVERASGLYVHMTNIQQAVEEEVRLYDDLFYQHIAFPERIIFPLRWMLQNFIGYYAQAEPNRRDVVAKQSFEIMFGKEVWSSLTENVLADDVLDELDLLSFDRFRDRCEEIAEQIMTSNWDCIVEFYANTLESFFKHHDLKLSSFAFLIDDLSSCRNALLEKRPIIDAKLVWSETEFVIDEKRGQVSSIVTEGA